MSLLTFIHEKIYTSLSMLRRVRRNPYSVCVATLLLVVLAGSMAQADWTIDFSKRSKELRKQEYIIPEGKSEKESLFDFIFKSGEPIQEVVIINTDKGFVPSTIRVVEGRNYRVHVVNVNASEKNVSFVLDAFSEHHATYFGKIKSFLINPKKPGVYTFQSPETSAQGRLVVHSSKQSVQLRAPASE